MAESNTPSAESLKTLYFNLMSKERFRYSMRDAFQYVSKCLCWKDRDLLRSDKKLRKHLFHSKGEDRITQDLDIVRLLKVG